MLQPRQPRRDSLTSHRQRLVRVHQLRDPPRHRHDLRVLADNPSFQTSDPSFPARDPLRLHPDKRDQLITRHFLRVRHPTIKTRPHRSTRKRHTHGLHSAGFPVGRALTRVPGQAVSPPAPATSSEVDRRRGAVGPALFRRSLFEPWGPGWATRDDAGPTGYGSPRSSRHTQPTKPGREVPRVPILCRPSITRTRSWPARAREYALLADGIRGGLIGPRGDIGRPCAPGWDSDAIFADLLGGRGRYTVTPVDRRFVWGGFYQHQTLIWTSRWVTTGGIIQCQEALAFPGDPHRVVLLRRVEALDGDAAVGVTLDPRGGFGRWPLREAHCDNRVWSARTGGLWLRWSGAAQARAGPDGALHQILRLPQGDTHDLVLEVCDHNLDQYPPVNHRQHRRTGGAALRRYADVGRADQ
jgi:hypothetical protein